MNEIARLTKCSLIASTYAGLVGINGPEALALVHVPVVALPLPIAVVDTPLPLPLPLAAIASTAFVGAPSPTNRPTTSSTSSPTNWFSRRSNYSTLPLVMASLATPTIMHLNLLFP